MSGIAIFMEGGGKGVRRTTLRKGMDSFLRSAKAAARRKSLRWQLVACGPRNEAYRQFSQAIAQRPKDMLFLLVDSEDEVKGSPRLHLQARDGWDRLSDSGEEGIQLMVRTMETWLIADVEALRSYYGRGFNANPLPKEENLEKVPKQVVSSGLDRATAKTQKGTYHKIRHASDLLALIDVEKARARCPHCERLFDALSTAMGTV